MDGNLQNFPVILKWMRDELRISQEDLAREIGVSFASVNRWENGKSSPSKQAKKQIQFYYDRIVQEGKISSFPADGTD